MWGIIFRHHSNYGLTLHLERGAGAVECPAVCRVVLLNYRLSFPNAISAFTERH